MVSGITLPLAVAMALPALTAAAPSAASLRAPGRSIVRVDPKSGKLQRLHLPPAAPVTELPPGPARAMPQLHEQVERIVEQTAQKHEVDPLLVRSVIAVESAGNPRAVSPKGAEGLMQLIPATARRFGAENSFDPRQNIEAGVKYLKFLQQRFNDDLTLTLAAYNAGEGAVAKYGNIVPPYAETQQYVKKVGQRYVNARKAKTRTAPSPAAAAVPAPPPPPEFRPLEQFVDAEGRIHLRPR